MEQSSITALGIIEIDWILVCHFLGVILLCNKEDRIQQYTQLQWDHLSQTEPVLLKTGRLRLISGA